MVITLSYEVRQLAVMSGDQQRGAKATTVTIKVDFT